MNKNVLAGLLGVAAVGVVIYQLMFAGGSTPPPPPPPPAGAPATGGAPAPAVAAPVVPGEAPTRLTSVNVNIDELLKGVQEVSFDYEAMRIDRDPLDPLVGQIRDQNALPVTGSSGVLEIKRKRITGILYDEKNPQAVVDDEVVGIGHVYPNGVKVLDIQKDKVIFQLGDSPIPVEMKEL